MADKAPESSRGHERRQSAGRAKPCGPSRGCIRRAAVPASKVQHSILRHCAPRADVARQYCAACLADERLWRSRETRPIAFDVWTSQDNAKPPGSSGTATQPRPHSRQDAPTRLCGGRQLQKGAEIIVPDCMPFLTCAHTLIRRQLGKCGDGCVNMLKRASQRFCVRELGKFSASIIEVDDGDLRFLGKRHFGNPGRNGLIDLDQITLAS
ncbi:hypothetical protein SAMN06265338_1362 [Rhodoblastus acidophilus]|uniref:Uncharacterized protein n=1 Tax=Rhodoblastus acidophilus TaxID=1074 RepID=A0A212SFG9_RHOAC|nr:hypothetical protein SAMN06265338_1362 [Rhodoblastus acidophilus]